MKLQNRIVQTAGLVALVSGCSSLYDPTYPHKPKEQQTITLGVSEVTTLQHHTWMLRYAGMPNEKTFSISWTQNSNAGLNLYYPTSVQYFCLDETRLHILTVDSEKVTFETDRCVKYESPTTQ